MKKLTDKTAKKQPRGRPFPKGVSGNPKGRPLGVKNFLTLFEEAVKKIAKERNIKEADVEIDLVVRAIAEARGGNYNYYRDIIDRIYGKPKERFEIGSGELPFKVIIEKGDPRNNKKS